MVSGGLEAEIEGCAQEQIKRSLLAIAGWAETNSIILSIIYD
jgi:hypothetical protein